MIQRFIVLLLVVFCIPVVGQNVVAFRIYNSQGKKVSFDKMAKDLSDKRVILFGEYHDDPIAHWIQLKLTQNLFNSGVNLILGAEMFESDVQNILNAYLSGTIEEDTFIDSTHSIWPNYKTDYKPLVEFAKSHNIDFVATNAPRPMARLVYRNGFEALDTLLETEKTYLPPLPVPYDKNLPGYVAMLEMSMGHGGDNLPKAQAIKDATMAWFISKGVSGGKSMLHFNGSYHSNNYDGIVWYLKQYAPEVSPATISMVLQKDVEKLESENKGIADYILVVDEEMTRTH